MSWRRAIGAILVTKYISTLPFRVASFPSGRNTAPMRHKTISIALTLFAGVLLTSMALRSQMPSVGPQWEYAVVSGVHGNAEICYAMTLGCRTERFNGGSDRDAVLSAATKLGDKGWELASATESSDKSPIRTLYFKRLKSVINKDEDRR